MFFDWSLIAYRFWFEFDEAVNLKPAAAWGDGAIKLFGDAVPLNENPDDII